MWVYVKPYWGRALLAILITIPIGAMDAVIAWALKPYMDVVMVQKGASYTAYIPLLIVLFTLIQSIFNYTATYMNTWVGQKISMGLKKDLYSKLLRYHAGFFDKQGDVVSVLGQKLKHHLQGLGHTAPGKALGEGLQILELDILCCVLKLIRDSHAVLNLHRCDGEGCDRSAAVRLGAVLCYEINL